MACANSRALGVVGCCIGRANKDAWHCERHRLVHRGNACNFCENIGVAIYLITGSDARLVSAKLTDLTAQLVGDGDRNTMLLSHDLETLSADERELAIATAMVGAQTSSLFGDERVVVLRGIGEATVDQLKPLVDYLVQPLAETQLVLTGSGKLAKSITDALKQAGATTINTSPPSRFNELSMWFQEQLTEAGLKVDSGALKMLIDWLGQDQARLPSIIEVLLSTYGTTKKLTVHEIEPFLGQEGSVMPWDLTDAIDLSNSPKAIAMLRRMMRSGESHPLQLMAILHNHYVKLLKLDGPEVHTAVEAMAIIGVKSEFQGKKYLETYRRMGAASISSALQLLARADIDLRGGKDLEEELTMEILVARLSRMGGAPQHAKTGGRSTSRR
ncbi:MAG: DNA polymerase III subunit delta [Actinobacteria bacterium]|nr:MAG: DNA polymerase III subunit delta [Actinomycetota bacterium]